MDVREAVVEDVPAFDRIRRAIYPWHIASVAAQRNWFHATTPDTKPVRPVALIEGEVAGFALGKLPTSTVEPGVATMYVNVDPAFRRRGVGKALYDIVASHLEGLGLRKVQVDVADLDEAQKFATDRGFRQGHCDRYSGLDPHHLPPMPPTPDGVSVVTVGSQSPEAMHALDSVAGADEPGDVSFDGMPFDEWMARIWNNPDQDLDISTVALVDGVPASVTFMEVNRDSGRAWTNGTATLREYRGRGLAKLVKSVALRKAAAVGVTETLTANDFTNKPMLAVNDWLGYKPVGRYWSYLRVLSED
jgi:GNAT superfamily N-acetyltransferase